MGYRNLLGCLQDLQRKGQLLRIEQEIDPHLEMAEIQRRVYQAQGPAILFNRVKDCRFPMVCNLFGTLERTRYLFRDTLEAVRHLVDLKIDPSAFWRRPWRYLDIPATMMHLLPKWKRDAPILKRETTIGQLPHLKCWPQDGGAFITLPQVYTEDVDQPGWRHSNLGMYRVQLTGNEYALDRQIGLHYQIHRGIGVHHAKALERGVPFRVNIFVGGPPVMTLAAVMPLPEGLPELAFAGALGGRRLGLARGQARDGSPWPLPLFAEADFCITGIVDPNLQLPEGPFGDHLGYYSLAHPFPVLQVEKVYHRPDAIWPFTVVGRPPQEDTSFGDIIHEITGPIIPTVVHGIHAVHAVDAAGVHPLLLALGSERYVPYADRRRPQELLTSANALLGQGQLSLAKYLLILAREDNPDLNIYNIPDFFHQLLQRVDWSRDLHFQSRTTIDTLDYTGSGFNEGSKLVIAAVGPPRRTLPAQLPTDLSFPSGFSNPRLCLPGVLAIKSPAYAKSGERPELEKGVKKFCNFFTADHPINAFPLLVLVDDSDFAAQKLNNFLWLTFTRSDPAADVHGIGSFVQHKHWGCAGSLIVDARLKPYQAPPLEEDPEVGKRVDQLAVRGGPLYRVI